MAADLKRVNPKQHALVMDTSPHVAGLCPRRAGKTYAGVMAALITGEAKPGAISLIISLNLKQLRRLYWDGGPSGIHALAKKYGVVLEFNKNELRWTHENGSIGYLLGADDDEQLEVIRGLEADLYLIDECKSFVAARLAKLIDDIIDPQRGTRQARVIMIGTPGFIAAGPFWEATCPTAVDKEGRRYYVDHGQKDSHGRTPREDLIWSRHTWTLQDNTAAPWQWQEALRKKRQKGWADDHPSWCREYLGMWTGVEDGLVFRFVIEKATLHKVTWVPARTAKNYAGLPPEGAPWRFIAGLDMGFEAPTALVVLAYSRKLKQLRHVWDVSKKHLLVDQVAELIEYAKARFGHIEKIYADVGNLGKMVVRTLIRDHGFPLEAADKREKNDYIELVNAAFASGEIKVLPKPAGSEEDEYVLEEQLSRNAWDLRDGTKEELARLGRLREDRDIPNDTTDAFLYAFRGSLHHFGQKADEEEPLPGSPEAVRLWEKRQLAAARAEIKKEQQQQRNANNLPRQPSFVQRALSRSHAWNALANLMLNGYRR